MIYLGIFYKNDGSITLQEFYNIQEIRKWWRKNENKYITYDIYMAKCINKKIRIEEKV